MGKPEKLGLVLGARSFRPIVVEGSYIVDDLYTGAKKFLEDSLGVDLDDLKKWDYLGSLEFPNSESRCPCFSVNITGMEDKIEVNKNKELAFQFVSIGEALKVDEASVLALFVKCFKHNIL